MWIDIQSPASHHREQCAILFSVLKFHCYVFRVPCKQCFSAWPTRLKTQQKNAAKTGPK